MAHRDVKKRLDSTDSARSSSGERHRTSGSSSSRQDAATVESPSTKRPQRPLRQTSRTLSIQREESPEETRRYRKGKYPAAYASSQ